MTSNALYDITHAIISLDPSTTVSVVGEDYDQITWGERGNPLGITIDQIKEKQVELEAEYNSQAYARNRKAEYDQLNQFEMQFDDDRDGTTTWVDTINEIKGRHPK